MYPESQLHLLSGITMEFFRFWILHLTLRFSHLASICGTGEKGTDIVTLTERRNRQ